MVVPADGAMVILLFVSIGFVGRRQYRVRAMTRLLLFALRSIDTVPSIIN